MAFAFAPLAILLIYDKCVCIPYLQTFRCCTIVSKSCYCPESPPLPY